MKRVEVKVAAGSLFHPDFVTLDGWVTEADPSLVITHEVYDYGEGYVSGGGWHVTHAPTGYRLPGWYSTRKEAAVYIESVSSLADWSVSDVRSLVSQPGLREKVLGAAK